LITKRCLLILVLIHSPVLAKVEIDVENAATGMTYKFSNIPFPVRHDLAETGKFEILRGSEDPGDGGLAVLNDGRIPAMEYAPDWNFFFQDGSSGGRLLLDLQKEAMVKRVDTYSQNVAQRGGQVYVVYVSDGSSPDFVERPGVGVEPEEAGWTRLAAVNAAGATDEGLCGVSVSDSAGLLGKFRYLLFDISSSQPDNNFGNTFFSEMDVISAEDLTSSARVGWSDEASETYHTITYNTVDGPLHLILDASAAPDLASWLDNDMAPFVAKWYPELGSLLAGPGYQAKDTITISLVPRIPGETMNGEGISGQAGADAFEGRIKLSIDFLRYFHMRGARGLLVHELTHVVQHYRYWSGRAAIPLWLVEGIADYMRIYVFAPEGDLAKITPNNIDHARYDAGYAMSANFLNWVAKKYDSKIVSQLNSAGREATYTEWSWHLLTGKSLQELGDEWLKETKASL
jgi:hypothetical protein